MPRALTRNGWADAVYGVVVVTGFEVGVAPALGLSRANNSRPVERLMLLADHLLYGVVLSPPRHQRA